MMHTHQVLPRKCELGHIFQSPSLEPQNLCCIPKPQVLRENGPGLDVLSSAACSVSTVWDGGDEMEDEKSRVPDMCRDDISKQM